MRTYCLSELEHRDAREAGVVFVRFDDDRPPDVDLTGEMPRVTITDPAVGHTFDLRADRLVPSTALVADPSVSELARAFRAPVAKDGFLLEAHIKLRPVDFAGEGMYMCGLAHAPKDLAEIIQRCRESEGVSGTHIMAVEWEEIVPEVIAQANLR